MIELTNDNVILHSYKDVDFVKGVRYLPAIWVDCEENEMDCVDLKKLILHNHETNRLVDVYLEQYKESIERGDADTHSDDIKFREVVNVLTQIKHRSF